MENWLPTCVSRLVRKKWVLRAKGRRRRAGLQTGSYRIGLQRRTLLAEHSALKANASIHACMLFIGMAIDIFGINFSASIITIDA